MLTRNIFRMLAAVILLGISSGCAQKKDTSLEGQTLHITAEMLTVLRSELDKFYPACIDTQYGGYFSDFDSAWKLNGPQDKMIVTQARYVWSASNAAMFYQKDTLLRSFANHGVLFLKNTMWDKQYGGFYDLVTRTGEPKQEDGQIIKRAYGQSFAIYGLANYFNASHDTLALRLAQEAFRWLDKHSYDPKYGGYFQFLQRDGTPFPHGLKNSPPKDQNSSIHLLECFTELYRVWPDSTLRERLSSMLRLIRDVITTEQGYLTLFSRGDWTPVSFKDSTEAVRKMNFEFDHVSFGHDVETAYLMLEASEVLGLKHDTTTLWIAKKMVDHALRFGWDKERGGIYDGGYYFSGQTKPTIVRNTKEWWSQAEALNSFFMMSDFFPQDTQQYYKQFCLQWDYCKKYVIDQEQGGWYWGGTDIVPALKSAPKATIWKGCYHTSRALIHCIQRMRSQAVTADKKQYDPVNKNASPEARKLLAYLYSIRGNKIIAGQHNYVGRIDTYPNRVKALTGKLPEIWGCDFTGYYHKEFSDTLIQEAYKKYKEGYIITLMWHVGRPQDDPPFGWKESIQAKLTDKEWEELITPGTVLNAKWTNRADTLAVYLKELQALGVPVLWRPFHELNGVWFWWGNRKGENGSVKLYKMMFDRFVHFHKLNNLIWVWNTNAPRQLIHDEAYAYEDFFPGLEYVDVLATDVYRRDYRQSHHDELANLGAGKVIALGEVGEVPSPEILEHQPLWSWFMIWGNFVDTHNTPEQMRALYHSPRVLTHEDFVTNK
jgi:cellobiose epimerase